MKRLALAAVLFAGCINFDEVLKECQKDGGRCVQDAGGVGGGGGGMADAGNDAGTDAGFDAGTDAGQDAGTDSGVDAGVDAGPCLDELCFSTETILGLVKGMDGVSDSEAWVVGGDGGAAFVARWDGTRWKDESPIGVPSMLGVHNVSPDHLWVAGLGGTVTRRFNGAWLPTETVMPAVSHLNSIWVAPTIGTFAVGPSNRIYRRVPDGGWVLEASGGAQLYAVWGASDTEVYAAGSAGTVLKREPDSGTWFTQPVIGLTNQTVISIWGSGPNDVWASAQGAGLFHFDGTTFGPAPVGALGPTEFVHGTGPNDVWVTSAAPAQLHRFDGGTWAEADAGLSMFDAGYKGPFNVFITPSSAFIVFDHASLKQSHVVRYRRGP